MYARALARVIIHRLRFASRLISAYLKQGALRSRPDQLGRLGRPLLLEKGAKVDVKDPQGMTALAHAGKSGREEIKKLLIAHGAKE